MSLSLVMATTLVPTSNAPPRGNQASVNQLLSNVSQSIDESATCVGP